MMVVRSGRALSEDNRANRRMEAISYRAFPASRHRRLYQCLHAVKCVAWFPADKVAGHTSLWGKRLYDFHHAPLPAGQNLLHAGQENLFLVFDGAYR